MGPRSFPGEMNSTGHIRLSTRVGATLPWLLLAIGSVHLTWSARQAAYSHSMDYGVVVEMARNMAAGSDFPVFFYGQAYMGSLEPALSALLCHLFGTHPFWVCMGSALFGIATLFAAMHMANRIAGAAGASITLALMICGGWNWIHFTVSPRGGYALASLLCLLATYLGAVAEFKDHDTGRIRIGPAATFGFLAGLAFWNFWIALPAFAAAGLALAFRLRAKVLSWRLLLPAFAAFLVGASPWILWAARNSDVLFSATSENIRTIDILGTASDIVNVVALKFFGIRCDAASFWRSPFPWPLVAMAAFTLADAILGGNARRRRLTATTTFYTVLFLATYAFTSFGASNASRYFVHLVPAYSLICGAALGAALARVRTSAQCRAINGSGGATCTSPRWRSSFTVIAAAIVFLAWAIFTAPRSFRTSNALMSDLRENGEKWAAAMREAARDDSLQEPAFADFRFFGSNWVTDRRLCFVSPLRWRYDPYLLRLEQAKAPAVICGSQAFGEFCGATQAKWRNRAVASLSVDDRIEPPQEMHEIDPGDIASISASDVGDCASALLDDNLRTMLTLRGTSSFMDIRFRQPCATSGILAIVPNPARFTGWRAESIGQDGSVVKTLAHCNPIGGWFWSGPRQYMFGPDCRLELRWPTTKVSCIRIAFEGRTPSTQDIRLVAAIADLRVLSDTPLPPMDVAEVTSAVENARRAIPSARVHAGRWLGPRVGAMPDPSLRFGRNGGLLAIPEVCAYTTLDTEAGAIAVLRGDAANAAEKTLGESGLKFSRDDAGGCSVFAISGAATGGNARRMRLYGGRLLRDEAEKTAVEAVAASATFGGKWRLTPTSTPPETILPGQSVEFGFMLSAEDMRRCRDAQTFVAYLHAVRDDRIIFQSVSSVGAVNALTPADDPVPVPMAVQLKVPDDATPGPVTFMLCLKNRGGRLRLAPKGDGIRTDRRRVVLGETVIR